MSILAYRILNPENFGDSKWKIPLKNSVILIILTIIIGLILNGLMIFYCAIDSCSGEAGMSFLIINGLIITFFIITLILNWIFSIIHSYFSNKGSIITLISIILIIFIINFSILFSNDFCLKGDENCFSKKALAQNNPELCEKAWICVSCYYDLAREKNEVELCKKILTCEGSGTEFEYNQCMSYFSRIDNNPSHCIDIKDECQKLDCCKSAHDITGNNLLSQEQAEECGIRKTTICGVPAMDCSQGCSFN